MPSGRPYDLKLDWAEKHLAKIERLVAKYEALTPYEVLPRVQDDHEPPRLHFTVQPHWSIPYIVGDFLYNVRAALDYLMKEIAPSSNRGDANFPIFWQGVWEPPIKGEDKERIEDRMTWAKYVKGIDERALTIIKWNQPETPAGKGRDDHPLAILRRLRNKDTHTRDNIVLGCLLDPITLTIVHPDARRVVTTYDVGSGLDDAAPLLGVPDDAVEVEIAGTVSVLVRPGMDELGGYRAADLRALLLDGTRRLFNMLRPFDRRAT